VILSNEFGSTSTGESRSAHSNDQRSNVIDQLAFVGPATDDLGDLVDGPATLVDFQHK